MDYKIDILGTLYKVIIKVIVNNYIAIYCNISKFRNRIVKMYFNIKDEMIYNIVYNNTNNSDIIEPTKEDKRFWVEKEENFI